LLLPSSWLMLFGPTMPVGPNAVADNPSEG